MNEDALLSQEMSIRDLMYTYREYIAKFKNIIFWGTGDNAKMILEYLACVLANDEEKNVRGGVERYTGNIPAMRLAGWSLPRERIRLLL